MLFEGVKEVWKCSY